MCKRRDGLSEVHSWGVLFIIKWRKEKTLARSEIVTRTIANNSVDEASGSHGMVLCMRVSNDGVIDEFHRTQLFCLHGGCVKHNRGNFKDE